MTSTAKAAAKRFYQRSTPLHGRSAAHKADIASIEKSAVPMGLAEKLVAQRIAQAIDSKVEAMLREQQGRRKRYRYDQAAVIGIEHLVEGPPDPITQKPLWRRMLRATKGATMLKDDFMRGARAILCQTSLYNHAAMAS